MLGGVILSQMPDNMPVCLAPSQSKVLMMFELEMTEDDFAASQESIEGAIAVATGVENEQVEVRLKQRRFRRILQDSIDVEVTITSSSSTVSVIEQQIRDDSFAEDLTSELETRGVSTTVSAVTEPETNQL